MMDPGIEEFREQLLLHRYDFVTLPYLIFPFGEPGTELEHIDLYDWQIEELHKLTRHLSNPETRYDVYRLGVSSGNGAAKTALGAIINICLLYTQQLRARVTANTDTQMSGVVWPEYEKWLRRARYNHYFFEVFGKSIRARDEELAKNWNISTFNWSEESPAAISGLHNKGYAVSYTFEEAPGIPAIIWDYARGAFIDTDTIKIFMAFGNSDDPDSKFEQNMSSPLWNSRRIDTRTLAHTDKKMINDLLIECGGDENHDEFRVRVRGLPRKTAKDSIIDKGRVIDALKKAETFDVGTVRYLPCILSCDPAWTGGDHTTIAYRQGNYVCLLEKYKLEKQEGDTHMVTFLKLCEWETKIKADAVFIDQGEGTAVYTLAINAGKTNWFLVNFSSNPNDNPDPKASQYANLRAQMYHEFNNFLINGGVLDAREKEWIADIEKELPWARGTRHKVTMKKLVESKKDIKDRLGHSPDVADVLVITGAYPVNERLPEHMIGQGRDTFSTGQTAYYTPPLVPDYDDVGLTTELYDP